MKSSSANFSNEWLRLSDLERSIITNNHKSIPVPVGAIAKELGLVVKLSTLGADISGEIRPDPESRAGYKIKVNRHEVVTRRRFTLAHEISHYLLHRDIIGNGISDNILYRSSLSNTIEAEANRLAADILMPWDNVERVILEFKKKGLDKSELVEYVAKCFNVSKPAIEIRLGLMD